MKTPALILLLFGLVTPAVNEADSSPGSWSGVSLRGLLELDSTIGEIADRGFASWVGDKVAAAVSERLPSVFTDHAQEVDKAINAGKHTYSIQSRGIETIRKLLDSDSTEQIQKESDDFWNWIMRDKTPEMIKDVLPDSVRDVIETSEEINVAVDRFGERARQAGEALDAIESRVRTYFSSESDYGLEPGGDEIVALNLDQAILSERIEPDTALFSQFGLGIHDAQVAQEPNQPVADENDDLVSTEQSDTGYPRTETGEISEKVAGRAGSAETMIDEVPSEDEIESIVNDVAASQPTENSTVVRNSTQRTVDDVISRAMPNRAGASSAKMTTGSQGGTSEANAGTCADMRSAMHQQAESTRAVLAENRQNYRNLVSQSDRNTVDKVLALMECQIELNELTANEVSCDALIRSAEISSRYLKAAKTSAQDLARAQQEIDPLLPQRVRVVSRRCFSLAE